MNTASAIDKDLWTIVEDPEAPGRFIGFAMSETGTPLTVTTSNRKHLEQTLIDWQRSLQTYGDFLSAWKKGVKIAGFELFNETSNGRQPVLSSDDAADIWQLVPNWDAVEFYVLKGKDSRWTRAFVAAMCSFYNHEWGTGMLKRLKVGSIGELASGLDRDRKSVLAALLVSYRGW